MTVKRLARWMRFGAAALLALSLFFPYLLQHIASLRLLAMLLGAFALSIELALSSLRTRTKVITAFLGGAYLIGTVATIEAIADGLHDRLIAVNAEHLFVLLPLYAVLGAVVYVSGSGIVYLRAFMAVAAVVAGLALVEAIFGFSTLGRTFEFTTTQREGLRRALVGSENALVLGTVFATLVPLTLKLTRLRVQIAMSVLLVAGAWATGSRAPALLCTAVAAVQFIPIVRRLLQRFTWVLYAAAAAAVFAVAYLASAVWTRYIPGVTGVDYSTNYRGALYSLLPELLTEHPFGYALATPPRGVWLVTSQLHGHFDITRSLDSEVVFAAFGLGWVGVTLYLVALFVSLAAIGIDVPLGLAASTLTGLGFLIALHDWDAMSPLWYGLLGACAMARGAPLLAAHARRARARGTPA